MRFLVIPTVIIGAIGLLSCGRNRAQDPSTKETRFDRESSVVGLRLTYAGGLPLIAKEPIELDPSPLFEGEILNLPLDTTVRLAARCSDRDAWTILLPPARVEASGYWRVRVDLPVSASQSRVS